MADKEKPKKKAEPKLWKEKGAGPKRERRRQERFDETLRRDHDKGHEK